MTVQSVFSALSQGLEEDILECSIGLHGQKVAAVSAHWPMELWKMSSSKPCDRAEKTLCSLLKCWHHCCPRLWMFMRLCKRYISDTPQEAVMASHKYFQVYSNLMDLKHLQALRNILLSLISYPVSLYAIFFFRIWQRRTKRLASEPSWKRRRVSNSRTFFASSASLS